MPIVFILYYHLIILKLEQEDKAVTVSHLMEIYLIYFILLSIFSNSIQSSSILKSNNIMGTKRANVAKVVQVSEGRSSTTATKKAFMKMSANTATQTLNIKEANDAKASIGISSFNLAKSIIGAGVLTLPGSIAYFSDEAIGLLPASAITIVMSLLAIYTFTSIGRSCEKTQSSSFRDVWSRSVGPEFSWIVTLSIIGKCFFSSLVYSIVIGDSFSSIASSFNLPAFVSSRSSVIIFLTTFVLLPLCSLKTLNALAPFSFLGLSGTAYTAFFLALRYFDGSYSPGGIYYQTLTKALQPSFGFKKLLFNEKMFVFIGTLGTAFVSHYNAPKFFCELKSPTVSRFQKVSQIGFSVSLIAYLFMMSMGFLTFGGNSMGFILNNYSNQDNFAKLARFAVGLTLITGYPFTFTALRDSILETLKVSDKNQNQYRQIFTYVLLSVVTVLALVLKDVGFVASISGALFGALLMFILPPVMHIANSKGLKPTVSNKIEKLWNYFIIILGFVMGTLGISNSISKYISK